METYGKLLSVLIDCKKEIKQIKHKINSPTYSAIQRLEFKLTLVEYNKLEKEIIQQIVELFQA